MTGRPDYDAGDLVVCVDVGVIRHPNEEVSVTGGRYLLLGAVYTVTKVCPWPWDDKIWDAWISEANSAASDGGFDAARFRRIDPKPPEFFAGKIETVREDELV